MQSCDTVRQSGISWFSQSLSKRKWGGKHVLPHSSPHRQFRVVCGIMTAPYPHSVSSPCAGKVFFSPPISGVNTASCAPLSTLLEQKPLRCKLMAHTHQLPSVGGQWPSTIWQMTGNPQPSLQSSLWLCPAFFSDKSERSSEGVTLIWENELIWVQCGSWRKGPWQPLVHCKCLTAWLSGELGSSPPDIKRRTTCTWTGALAFKRVLRTQAASLPRWHALKGVTCCHSSNRS